MAFSRDEICVLGLPFDRVNEAQAIAVLDQAISENHPCFLSTPNLNFAISAMEDSDFRDSVLQSDLSVADGMPLIWLSRLIGEPLPERVAGSSLFERMRRRVSSRPLSVYFFGGMDDVAERAVTALNLDSSGMTAVGALNPGIGSIEDMSSPEIIDSINLANPDFLVVSLGAKKGQSWIIANQSKLNARVLSHLGAVVNFVAGTVDRAPGIWQKLGLEWVWRIIEEPGLWKRYFFDGLKFCFAVTTKALPLAIYGRYLRSKHVSKHFQYSVATERDGLVVSFAGAAHRAELDRLKAELPELLKHGSTLVFDLRGLEFVDSSFWALLLRVKTESAKLGLTVDIQNMPATITRLANLHMMERLVR